MLNQANLVTEVKDVNASDSHFFFMKTCTATQPDAPSDANFIAATAEKEENDILNSGLKFMLTDAGTDSSRIASGFRVMLPDDGTDLILDSIPLGTLPVSGFWNISG